MRNLKCHNSNNYNVIQYKEYYGINVYGFLENEFTITLPCEL